MSKLRNNRSSALSAWVILPSEENSRQICYLEHVVFGKVVQPRIKSGAGLCRNLL